MCIKFEQCKSCPLQKNSGSRHITEKNNLIGHNTNSHGHLFFRTVFLFVCLFSMIMDNKDIFLTQEKPDDHLNLGQHNYFEELNNWQN